MADQITIDRAVVQQALEALQTELMGYDGPVPHIDSAITALKAALAQAEPVQERTENLAQRLRAKGYEAEESGSAVENIKESGNG